MAPRPVLTSKTPKPPKPEATKHPVLHSKNPGELEDAYGDVTGTIHLAGPKYTRDSAGNITATTKAAKTTKTSKPTGGTYTTSAAGSVSATTSTAKTHKSSKKTTGPRYIGEPGGGPMQGYIDALKAAGRYGRKSTVAPKGYVLEEGPHGGRILVKKTASSGKTHTKATTRKTTTTKGHTAKHSTTNHSTGLGTDSRNATPLPPGPINPTQARITGHAGHIHPKGASAPRVTPASATRTHSATSIRDTLGVASNRHHL